MSIWNGHLQKSGIMKIIQIHRFVYLYQTLMSRSLSHFEVQLIYNSDISYRYVISCVGCLKLRKMYTVHVRCTYKNIIGRGHMAQRVSFNPSKSMPYLKKNLPRNAKHLLSLSLSYISKKPIVQYLSSVPHRKIREIMHVPFMNTCICVGTNNR